MAIGRLTRTSSELELRTGQVKYLFVVDDLFKTDRQTDSKATEIGETERSAPLIDRSAPIAPIRPRVQRLRRYQLNASIPTTTTTTATTTADMTNTAAITFSDLRESRRDGREDGWRRRRSRGDGERL